MKTQQQKTYYTIEEYRAAVALGVRKGWVTFKPEKSPEMTMHNRAALGDIPKGIYTPPPK